MNAGLRVCHGPKAVRTAVGCSKQHDAGCHTMHECATLPYAPPNCNTLSLVPWPRVLQLGWACGPVALSCIPYIRPSCHSNWCTAAAQPHVQSMLRGMRTAIVACIHTYICASSTANYSEPRACCNRQVRGSVGLLALTIPRCCSCHACCNMRPVV